MFQMNEWHSDCWSASQWKEKRNASMPTAESHLQFISKLHIFMLKRSFDEHKHTEKRNIGIKKHYEINSVCMFTKIKFFASISFRASQIWCFIMVLFLFLFLYFTFHILHFTIYREKEILLPLSRSLIHISSNWKIN